MVRACSFLVALVMSYLDDYEVVKNFVELSYSHLRSFVF